MTFGSFQNMIGCLNNDKFEPKKYQGLTKYDDSSCLFKSQIKISNHGSVCGNMANKMNDGSLFIENVGETFRINDGETYPYYDQRIPIDKIIYEYFRQIKEYIEKDQVESLSLVLPYEYSDSKKKQLLNILKTIPLTIQKTIDEPIACYLGYLKINQLPLQQKDSFMIVTIENNALKVKIFDVQCLSDSDMFFHLESFCFDMSFRLYDSLRSYFLKKIDSTLSYESLYPSDQQILDEAIDKLIQTLSNRDKVCCEQFYIGLPELMMDYEFGDFTSQQLVQILDDSGVYQTIMRAIYQCLDQSHKNKDDIQKIIYTGSASIVYGIQEKINSHFHLHQKISLNIDEMICLGALSYPVRYQIEDHLKQIGTMVKRQYGHGQFGLVFRTMLPSYSQMKMTSIPAKIPRQGILYIFEGYLGAGIHDCTLLKRVDLTAYTQGIYQYVLEKLSNGGKLSVLIYDQNNEVINRIPV